MNTLYTATKRAYASCSGADPHFGACCYVGPRRRCIKPRRRPHATEEGAVERFIRRKNIEHYRKLLAETADEAERRLIEKLLAAEEAREAADPASGPSPKGNP